jgi:hypothetical protein
MWPFNDRSKNKVVQVGHDIPPSPSAVDEFHNNPTQASMGDMMMALPKSNDKDVQAARDRVYSNIPKAPR